MTAASVQKHKFKPREKFGVWNAYGGFCFWCGEPLEYRDLSVDHVVPESVGTDELEQIKTEFGLPADFAINDFENWVPTHQRCNRSKSNTLYLPTPAMIATLDKARKQAPKARKAAIKIDKSPNRAEILSRVEQALKDATIDFRDLHELFEGLEKPMLLKGGTESLMLVDDRGIRRTTKYVEFQCGRETEQFPIQKQRREASPTPPSIRLVAQSEQREAGGLDAVENCPACGRPMGV